MNVNESWAFSDLAGVAAVLVRTAAAAGVAGPIVVVGPRRRRPIVQATRLLHLGRTNPRPRVDILLTAATAAVDLSRRRRSPRGIEREAGPYTTRPVRALLLVLALLQYMQARYRLQRCAGRIVERRSLVVRIAGGDPMDRLPGHRLLARRLVGDPAVDPRVPGVEIDNPTVHPGAVGQAEILQRQSHDPVGAGNDLGHQGEQVIGRIGSKDGEGPADHVGSLIEAASLDNAADVLAGSLHVDLELLGLTGDGEHGEGGRGELPVLPEVVVDAVAGTDEVGELRLPLIHWEVLRRSGGGHKILFKGTVKWQGRKRVRDINRYPPI
jgi:hypothetical protein